MRHLLAKVRKDAAAYAEAERCKLDALFWLRMVLVTPGFQFVLSFRVQEAVRNVPLVGRVLRLPLWWLTCMIHRCEIAKAATIEGGLYIPHPYGIVIGRCRIGENVAILHNVTIGTKRIEDRASPVIGDGVVLGAGCAILGAISVGSGSIVGANAVVLEDVPQHCVVAGAPARVIQGSAVHGALRSVGS